MYKIAFIGAGSLVFTRGLIRDLLTFPKMNTATIALMDINEERLEFAVKATQSIIDHGGYKAKIEATLDRRQALANADAVLCTILAGDVNVWQHDILIPKKYGIDINVGDTRGPSGIFRALRTIPVMLDICVDIEAVCPEALFLNYTNPMAMLCRAIQRKTNVQITGLCHSVQGTAQMLAEWIKAPFDEITYLCAGINHMAWFLNYEWGGKDAYPLLRNAINKRSIYKKEIVRNEMFLALDYYVTESSGHNSEYNWWFRKRPDLIKKYCLPGTGWNPGEHAYILNSYRNAERTWKREVKKWLAEGAPMSLERGHEYAASIINAYLGGEPYVFNGNVPNTELIPNLPANACVEVPVLVQKKKLYPMHVGELPLQLAALNNIAVASEEMAVEAALTGDAKLLYQAIALDPLTAAVLSLNEIRKMTNEMLRKNCEFLPQFDGAQL